MNHNLRSSHCALNVSIQRRCGVGFKTQGWWSRWLLDWFPTRSW